MYLPGDTKGNVFLELKDTKNKNGQSQQLLGSYTLPSLPTARLKLGFAASIGADVNYHEVRTLYITTSGGLRITKSVDKPMARVGDELTYTVDGNLTNDTAKVSTTVLDPKITLVKKANKTNANGKDTHPLYVYLKEQTGGRAISW